MNDFRQVLDLFDEQKDFWKKKVADGIEQHRKGDATIQIVDQNKVPVKDAKVKIKQKNHEFRFGANLFMLDELETPEKNERYKKAFSDVFNMATLPFYWDSLEPERGKPRYAKDSSKVYRRPPIDLCIEFCEKHGIEPREHALAYEHFFPEWLYEASVEEIKKALEKRYAEISARYAEKIPTIEVTNEMGWAKGKTAFYDDPDYVRWCFALAEKYFPNNRLVINDSTGRSWQDNCRATDKYYAYTEATMLKGARIDAIGMQYHLFNRREEMYEKTRETLNPKSLYKRYVMHFLASDYDTDIDHELDEMRFHRSRVNFVNRVTPINVSDKVVLKTQMKPEVFLPFCDERAIVSCKDGICEITLPKDTSYAIIKLKNELSEENLLFACNVSSNA